MDLMPLIDWVRNQTLWERSEELAAQMMKPERVMALGRPQRPHAQPGGALRPPRQPRRPRSAQGRDPGRAINPLVRDFMGCYHCGATDHSRTPNERSGQKGCPRFEALIKQHNGLPQGYKGKLEMCLDEQQKALGARQPKVASLVDEPPSEPANGSDCTESDFSDGGGEQFQEPVNENPRCTARVIAKPIPECTPTSSQLSTALAMSAEAPVPGAQPSRPRRVREAPALCRACPQPEGSSRAVVHGTSDDGDNGADVSEAFGWSCPVRLASESRQRKLRHVTKRMSAMTDDELELLRRMLTSSAKKDVRPPPPFHGKKWSMVDLGSEPSVANCKRDFPDHAIKESGGQRRCLKYNTAAGDLVAKECEINLQHVDNDGNVFDFRFSTCRRTLSHPKRYPVGYSGLRGDVSQVRWYILYPDGRPIRFIAKDGVSFVLLNVAHPDCHWRGCQ